MPMAITFEEGIKLHSDWTEAAFKSLDTNTDGSLNELEYETAVTAPPAASDPAAGAIERKKHQSRGVPSSS